MMVPNPRIYFVLTLRGDRGPLDQEGVQALLAGGEARPEDHVRNAWGKQIGTVAEVVHGRKHSGTSDRMRHVKHVPQHFGTTAGGSDRTKLVVVITAVVLVAFGLLAALTTGPAYLVVPAPVERTPSKPPVESQPARPQAASTPVSEPRSAVPVHPTKPPTSAPPVISATTPSTPVIARAPPVARPIPTTVPAVIVPAQPVEGAPAGWVGCDIGGGIPGTGQQMIDGVWTLTCTGPSSRYKDRFHLVSRPWSGDGMVTALLRTMNTGDNPTSVGVIMRGGFTDAAPAILLRVASTMMVHIGERVTDNAVWSGVWTTTVNAVQLPSWIRLVRKGAEYSCWLSGDGQTWRQTGQNRPVPPALGNDVFAGIMVYNELRDTLAGATFSEYSVQPLPSGFPPER